MPTEKSRVGNSSFSPRLRREPGQQGGWYNHCCSSGHRAHSPEEATDCAGACIDRAPSRSKGDHGAHFSPQGPLTQAQRRLLRGRIIRDDRKSKIQNMEPLQDIQPRFLKKVDFKGKTERKRKFID